jgi:hypothetical protein
MFRDHGLEPPEWGDALPALEAAGAGRETDLANRGRVLPGVRQALKAVAEEEGMISPGASNGNGPLWTAGRTSSGHEVVPILGPGEEQGAGGLRHP